MQQVHIVRIVADCLATITIKTLDKVIQRDLRNSLLHAKSNRIILDTQLGAVDELPTAHLHAIYKKDIAQGEEEQGEPPLLQDNSKGAVIVTNQAMNQFASVATLPARPMILMGRI